MGKQEMLIVCNAFIIVLCSGVGQIRLIIATWQFYCQQTVQFHSTSIIFNKLSEAGCTMYFCFHNAKFSPFICCKSCYCVTGRTTYNFHYPFFPSSLSHQTDRSKAKWRKITVPFLPLYNSQNTELSVEDRIFKMCNKRDDNYAHSKEKLRLRETQGKKIWAPKFGESPAVSKVEDFSVSHECPLVVSRVLWPRSDSPQW